MKSMWITLYVFGTGMSLCSQLLWLISVLVSMLYKFILYNEMLFLDKESFKSLCSWSLIALAGTRNAYQFSSKRLYFLISTALDNFGKFLSSGIHSVDMLTVC